MNLAQLIGQARLEAGFYDRNDAVEITIGLSQRRPASLPVDAPIPYKVSAPPRAIKPGTIAYRLAEIMPACEADAVPSYVLRARLGLGADTISAYLSGNGKVGGRVRFSGVAPRRLYWLAPE